MRKRSILLLALALIMVLSACGQPPVDNGNKDNDVFDPTQIVRKDWKENEYAEPVDVTVTRYDPTSVEYGPGESIDNSVWDRAYLEELGIRVKNKWVVEYAQMATKTNLMLSSGDLADIFFVNEEQFAELVELDMIEDLSKVYLEYVSDEAKELLLEAGPSAMASSTIDGRLMAIPKTMNWLEIMGAGWIRKDWLDKAGLGVPTNPEELENAMLTIAKDNKATNLLLTKDSLGPADSNFAGNNYIFDIFNSYPLLWVEKNGKLEWGGIQPEVKDALSFLKRLYDAGALNKEFSSIDNAKGVEDIANSKVGTLFADFWSGAYYINQQVSLTGETDNWVAFDINNSKGTPTKHASPVKPEGYYVVRKGYEHPEVLIKFLNMHVQEFYINCTDKDRYLYLVQDENNKNPKWNLSVCQPGRSYNNILNYRNMRAYLETGDEAYWNKISLFGKTNQETAKKFEETGDLKSWQNWFNSGYNPGAASGITSVNIENGNYQSDAFYGFMTPTMKDSWGLMQSRQQEAFQNIVNGGDLADFDAFVAEWKALGGDTITDEVNDWYENYRDLSDNPFIK